MKNDILKKYGFYGISTALLTPFIGQKIDYYSLEKVVASNIRAGVCAFVLFGSTGEHFSLTDDEKKQIFFTIKEITQNKLPLICCVGSPSTKRALNDALIYKSYGADGLLILPPFYYKCSDNGVIAHFFEILNGAKMPAVIYNVPARTGYDLFGKTDVLNALSSNPYAVAVKQAESDEEKIKPFTKKCPLAVLSGCDENNLAVLKNGGGGAVSVASNLFPAETVKLFNLFYSSEQKAEKFNLKLKPLFTALSLESNPVPLKYLFAKIYGGQNALRLPFLTLSPENEKKADELLKLFYKNLNKEN